MNVDAYKKKITLSRIACFIALQCALSIHNTALAREYFNPAFLGIDGPGKDLTDLSAFEEGIGQIPGNYHVDVIVNKTSVGLYDIDFVMQKIARATLRSSPVLALRHYKNLVSVHSHFPSLLTVKIAPTYRLFHRPMRNLSSIASSYASLSHKLH